MSDLSRIRAVCFDLDEVLVDSRIAIPRSINFALECQGLAPRPEESLHRWIGSPLLHAFREILEQVRNFCQTYQDPSDVSRCQMLFRELLEEGMGGP